MRESLRALQQKPSKPQCRLSRSLLTLPARAPQRKGVIIIDFAQRNLNLGFDLTKGLAGASSLSEIVELHAVYWRKQFDAFTTQAEEVRGAAKPKVVETWPEAIQRPSGVRPPDERQSGNPKKGAAQDEALQQILPAEIEFGMLDGNAVALRALRLGGWSTALGARSLQTRSF